MASKEKFIKNIESKMKKYKNKVLEIDGVLKKGQFHDKEHLLSENKSLKETLKQAENIFQKLKSSSAENFEEIKESASDIFDSLKEALGDFSHLLTMDQLYHAKDDIVEYGCEKVSDVEEYIKKKPLTCAAGAFGIGFLIGTFLTRSK